MNNQLEIIELLRTTETTVIIGSGLYKELGYPPYYDYQPNRYNVSRKEKSLFLKEKIGSQCTDLVDSIAEYIGIIRELYDLELFNHIIDVSPYCSIKCLINDVNCLLLDRRDESFIEIGSALNYQKYREALIDLMSSELILVMGVSPHLSPLNMLVLLPKIKDVELIVIDSSYNPYCEVADICVKQSIIGFLRNIRESLAVSL
ncbi:MAG: hypothetical protein GXO43_02540 [Crenarchaeota archaeon]|nr:hypothetical protein [Thermoproteota archaeon]